MDKSLIKSATSVTEDINRKVKRSLFKSKKRIVRYGLLASNIVILILVAAFILNTRNSDPTSDAPVLSLTQEKVISDPLDQLSGADIAVNVALLVRMDQITSVINRADTVNSQIDVIPNDSQVVAKPQIVETSLKSKKDVINYTVAEGDSVESLAVKFGLTSETIRLSNGITGSALEVGKTLLIPPVNGLIYKVKNGDTPDNLASKYRAEKSRIIAFNDAEIGGLVEGDNIVIPDGQAPIVPARNSYVGGFAFGSAAVYGYNGYDYGWCTWWAAKRRADVGKPIPANFGDACNWVRAAQRASIPTGSTPSGAGDVIFTNSGCLGHVAFVEEMNEDGSIWVSDMNSRGQVSKSDPTPAGGWNRVSWRLVTPDQFGRFQFIY
ncbi:MAG: LysM peptidoglycan-binding domain-containing protein [Candidatus Saccharibacteria bacterium]|nr:LysM peptidoglycan-binding domain-containing protein [Candidatus Saccharibacteria bacterium]